MIRYRCAKCRALLESPSSLAGQHEECPLCGTKNVVPHSGEPGPGLWFAFGGLVGLAVLALATVVVWQTTRHSQRPESQARLVHPEEPLAPPTARTVNKDQETISPELVDGRDDMEAKKTSVSEARRPPAPLPRRTTGASDTVPRPIPTLRRQSRSGRLTVEEVNKRIVEQLFQATGERDVPRRQSFSATDWPDGKTLVRVLQDNVPILGAPNLNAPKLDVLGVARQGEIFALVNQKRMLSLVNPLSSVPDQSGVWYNVAQLEGKQGWIFAHPQGHRGSPIAIAVRNGKLVHPKDEIAQPGKTSTEAMDNAHAAGAKAGYNDGLRDGDAAGFEDAFKPAYDASFNETLTKLCDSGNYRRIPFYTFLAMASGFLLGFGIQYVVTFTLRKCRFLPDIDPILLGSHGTEYDLSALALPPVNHKHNGAVNDHKFMLLFFAVALLLFIGCRDQEKEVWEKGYEANYKAGTETGREGGEARGSKIGTEKGAAAAKEAAQNGRTWQLYKTLAIGWLTFGALAGLLAQYIVLLACRLSGRLQELFQALASQEAMGRTLRVALGSSSLSVYQHLTVAFVPAMKNSESYSIFEQLQRLRAKLMELVATEQLYAANIQAVENTLAQALEAASTVESFGKVGWGRLLALARAELAKVVSQAQAQANRGIRQDPHAQERALIQPHRKPASEGRSRRGRKE